MAEQTITESTPRRVLTGDSPLVDFSNLEAHPLAALMPMIKAEEFDKLKADIRKHGLQVKIKLYQGKILDGRNRYKALKALADEGEITWTSSFFEEFIGTAAQAESFVISTNLQRRQMTGKEKKEVLIRMMGKYPDASGRKIAEICGVAHSFVGKIVDELKEPERKKEEAFAAFARQFDNETDEFRVRFVKEYAKDIREILAEIGHSK
jgi:hypothetical protein